MLQRQFVICDHKILVILRRKAEIDIKKCYFSAKIAKFGIPVESTIFGILT
jgi:hypothetical protein